MILNKTKRCRDADIYYRNHHGIDTIIEHSLGGAVSLALENNTKKKVITLMESFNLTLSVRLLYQVIVQAPTLTELDGLGIRFLHLTLIAPQLCHHSNKGLIVQLIVIMVCLLRMLCQFMLRCETT